MEEPCSLHEDLEAAPVVCLLARLECSGLGRLSWELCVSRGQGAGLSRQRPLPAPGPGGKQLRPAWRACGGGPHQDATAGREEGREGGLWGAGRSALRVCFVCRPPQLWSSGWVLCGKPLGPRGASPQVHDCPGACLGYFTSHPLPRPWKQVETSSGWRRRAYDQRGQVVGLPSMWAVQDPGLCQP